MENTKTREKVDKQNSLNIVVSNTYCVFLLPLVYFMFPLSLVGPFTIVFSVFSNGYYTQHIQIKR